MLFVALPWPGLLSSPGSMAAGGVSCPGVTSILQQALAGRDKNPIPPGTIPLRKELVSMLSLPQHPSEEQPYPQPPNSKGGGNPDMALKGYFM